ncbi:MAG: acetylxylan esterase, partial [Candidatus Limnocylindrales bacterium]
MALTDMPIEEMRAYRPALDVPGDLHAFWQASLDDARQHDLAAKFSPFDSGLSLISTFDVEFAGYGGSTVRGWLHL